MRSKIKIVIDLLVVIARIVSATRPKVYFVGGTTNRNLGDNAQFLCIREWIQCNYGKHRLIEISISLACCPIAETRTFLFSAVIARIWLLFIKLFQRKGDLIITNSGYGFIDHTPSWLIYARMAVACKKTPIVIMPQTVNFMNPWIEAMASKAFAEHPSTVLLCRDFVSYEKAKEPFRTCKIIAYPDIVTNWIGTRQYACHKEGVLFCLRKDREAYYSEQQITEFVAGFKQVRTEIRDTNAAVSSREMAKRRKQLIDEFLAHMATFQVVVTDRYHGTIFALITETPVIVIDSNDHKLKSGVKWYPESFSDYVCFAGDLNEASRLVKGVLSDRRDRPHLPRFFKELYYDQLKGKIHEAL